MEIYKFTHKDSVCQSVLSKGVVVQSSEPDTPNHVQTHPPHP